VGIRETLNQKPAIAKGATVVLILAALGVIVWSFVGSGSGPNANAGQKAFFTIDDGKTWFEDDVKKLPPFDKDGKTAYQCFVWTCDGGKNKFVSHLQRYTPDAKRRLEEAQAKGPAADPESIKRALMTGIEVKAPGNGDDPKNWVKDREPRATQITQPRCKEGKREDLQQVTP
jgi:hypothetical protein